MGGLVVGEAKRSGGRGSPRLTTRSQLAPYLRQIGPVGGHHGPRASARRPSPGDQQTDSFGNPTVNARLCAPALAGGPVTYDPQTSAACPRTSPEVQFSLKIGISHLGVFRWTNPNGGQNGGQTHS